MASFSTHEVCLVHCIRCVNRVRSSCEYMPPQAEKNETEVADKSAEPSCKVELVKLLPDFKKPGWDSWGYELDFGPALEPDPNSVCVEHLHQANHKLIIFVTI